MQNENSGDVSAWLKRFHNIERSPEQLVHTANTTDAFSAAATAVAAGAPFESEPSQFFALLHELAPDELKK